MSGMEAIPLLQHGVKTVALGYFCRHSGFCLSLTLVDMDPVI